MEACNAALNSTGDRKVEIYDMFPTPVTNTPSTIRFDDVWYVRIRQTKRQDVRIRLAVNARCFKTYNWYTYTYIYIYIYIRTGARIAMNRVICVDYGVEYGG